MTRERERTLQMNASRLYLVPALLLMISEPALAAGGMELLLSDIKTVFFIGVAAVLTVYFAFIRFDRFAVTYGPEILTTVGIFGCFLAIAYALLGFDPNDAQKSVPLLLKGVQTAFWASVAGVCGALIIRFRHQFGRAPIAQREGAPKAASLDDVVMGLQSLQKSLSGTEEGTLLSQLKLMRQEQSDQLSALRHSFETFASKMAEDGSKALIDALKSVIADFNARINEQFGENFKQLNAAVEKLVVWQQQYKDELDQLQAVEKAIALDLRSGSESLKQVASMVEGIVRNASGLSDAAKQLETLLKGLDQQFQLLKQGQEEFNKVMAEMRQVTPEFAKKIDSMIESLRSGAEQLRTSTTQAVTSVTTQVTSANAEMKSLLTDTLRQSQSEVARELASQLDVLQKGVKTLDSALEQALTKSLDSLGQQLASISGKFASDYGPLADRLREVVRIAEQAR